MEEEKVQNKKKSKKTFFIIFILCIIFICYQTAESQKQYTKEFIEKLVQYTGDESNKNINVVDISSPIKDEITNVKYEKNGEKYMVYRYYEDIFGIAKLNNIDNKYKEEKFKSRSKNSEGKEVLILLDGAKGEFGYTGNYDNQQFMLYKLPEGNYKVIHKRTYNDKPYGRLYVDKDKKFINSSGFEESERVYSISLEEDMYRTFEVKEDTHIMLTANTAVVLEKVE